jgi:DNA-binding IscR family transcriptional regulator
MSDEAGDDLAEVGLWLSVSEIARQKEKSRQAIAKRVDSLVEAGLLETRPGPNGTKLVNLAQFDRAVGDTGDAFKEAGAETRAEAEADPTAVTSPALRDHQARAAQYTADLKFLDLEERLGRLVPVAEVKDAGQKAAEAIVRIVDRLPTYAEALAVVAVKDGTAGARGKLKDIARELRTAIADAMDVIAAEAEPSTIEPGEVTDPA